MGDCAFVLVVVYAAYYGGWGNELGGEVACWGVVVHEQPLGGFGAEGAIFGEVGEGDEVVVCQTGWSEDGGEFGSEGEVGSREVGERDVQVVGWGVGAEIGEEDGGAEGVQIWSGLGMI